MSLRELFPGYSLTLRSPRGCKTKFGTRDVYVDFPWQAYRFLQAVMDKAVRSGLTKEEVKEKWHEFLLENKDTLLFDGKSLVSVSLIASPLSTKSFLELRVNWPIFVKYLERKASRFMSEINRHAHKIMKAYKEIRLNIFYASNTVKSTKHQYSPFIRERFLELLNTSGDWQDIQRLIDLLETLVAKIEEGKKREVEWFQLYTTNLQMEIQHLRSSMEAVNIPGGYLLLRNMLETLVKMYVYADIGRSIDSEGFVLVTMFLYEYEVLDKRQKKLSLRELTDRLRLDIMNLVSRLPPIKEVVISEFIEKLRIENAPTLWIDRKTLREFSIAHSLDGGIDQLYSACSKVIHNQPPLPFFSLLEVKVFKHFLQRFVHSLRMIAEGLIHQRIDLPDIDLLGQS
nr:hypothetical protein [Candidatus Njordarchaeota archaeon]